MKWYKPLFLGENARKEKLRSLKRVKNGKYMKDVFFITLPSNNKNLLDIISTNQLLWPYFRKRKVRSAIYVIGIARGRDEAYEVVRTIIDETYTNTGGFDIKGYLNFGPKE